MKWRIKLQIVKEDVEDEIAKEMFNDLGYTKYNEDGFALMYYEPSENFGIIFDLIHRYVEFGDGCMTINDLKAIYKQIEELGWLDE